MVGRRLQTQTNLIDREEVARKNHERSGLILDFRLLLESNKIKSITVSSSDFI